MKIICNQKLLAHKIGIVQKAINSKTNFDLLKGILIVAKKDQIVLTGYDLEIGIETYAQAEIAEEGSIVINARLFGDIIRKLPDSFVEIETDDENNVYINCINSKFKIKGAPFILAGGYGVGSKENFKLLYDLAATIGGEVGASRAAVDAGFAEHERQIGQTGVTVRPKLYIACGISGQIQHIAGMQDSSMIIAINNDPNAPINTIADYVITGTVEDILPKMIKYYKKNSK